MNMTEKAGQGRLVLRMVPEVVEPDLGELWRVESACQLFCKEGDSYRLRCL